MTQPFFSIIVPTFNRPARLLECVSSLARLQYPRNRFELIIANDGWDTPTETELSSSAGDIDFTIVSLPHRGPAAARNRAVRESTGMYLAFIDDDCTADNQWLARMETFFGTHPDALAGGKTLNSLGSNVYSEASQALIDYLYGYYNGTTAEREQFFASNNMAVSAERFRDLGGFDESYGRAAAEDRDFCERWRQAGRSFGFVPDAIVRHSHELSARSFLRQHFTYGRGAFIFRRRCAEQGARRVRVEPLNFYSAMLSFPRRRGHARAGTISSLVMASQVANAAGFFFEAAASALPGSRSSLASHIDTNAKRSVALDKDAA